LLAHLTDQRRGTLLGVIAYLIWGVAALYWIQTEPVDARDLLAHRALWSLPFILLCLAIVGRGRLTAALALFRQPRTIGILACAAFFGALNWLIFLWAVTHGRAAEASLGYFLLPLVNVAIGLTVFRETIDTPQKLGIAFAVAAVLLQLVYHGGLPWVALGLPLSFGLYGAIRKAVKVESMEGTLLEVMLMAPVAIAWLVYRDGGGLGLYGTRVDLFLLGAGAFTAVPLISYVAASRLLPLTALGLVFYIGPTTQLLVAVVVFGEPLDAVQIIAFGLVWVGLALVTLDSLRRSRALRRSTGAPLV
jgi:chloramphenicol-sensitive protein RarD